MAVPHRARGIISRMFGMIPDKRLASWRPWRAISCLLVLCLWSPAFAWSQQANVNLDFDPHRNKENLTPFSAPLNSPEVHDDHTVTFRMKAPGARQVSLVGAILTALGRAREPLPFTRGEGGIWTLTIGPVRPDIYAHHFERFLPNLWRRP